MQSVLTCLDKTLSQEHVFVNTLLFFCEYCTTKGSEPTWMRANVIYYFVHFECVLRASKLERGTHTHSFSVTVTIP